MGNSIRWLKLEISKVDPGTPEETAKKDLCEKIDTFIRERITVAHEVIAKAAAEKIQNDDVILTAHKSYIVQETLLYAKKHQGKNFRVYIIDSRPLNEGRALADALKAADIEVTYSYFHAVAHAAREATKCILGAHAMMSNGGLFSRCGTAMVALNAHVESIPVIVCCESIKFSERVALDSIVHNEIASPDELVGTNAADSLSKLLSGMPVSAIAAGAEATSKAKGKGKDTSTAQSAIGDKLKETKSRSDTLTASLNPIAESSDDDSSDDEALKLETWRGEDNDDLTMLNLMYDLTPAEYVDMVVCEHGNLPPTSVPVVHRMISG
jgi:translation initiation factor eIF-2B subunit delta